MGFLNKIFKARAKDKEEKGVRKGPDFEAKKSETGTEGQKRSFVATGILTKPHITEKASLGVSAQNTYVFAVTSRANKTAIKKAVEKRYDTRVEAVRVINLPGKERKRGKQVGWKPGLKKAMVKLKEGETIEIQ